MYINFPQLLDAGLDVVDLVYLIAIRQREDLVQVPEERETKYLKLKLIEHTKTGVPRLSKKGSELIRTIETPGATDDVYYTLDKMVSMYESYGKPIGDSIKEAESRLIWFMGETNFKPSVILDAVMENLESEYSFNLCNLIWKAPSIAYSVHYNLKNSKLFELIARKYRLSTMQYYKEDRDKTFEWLFAIARLPNPPMKIRPEYLITGDVKTEKERIKAVKTELSRLLTKRLGGQ